MVTVVSLNLCQYGDSHFVKTVASKLLRDETVVHSMDYYGPFSLVPDPAFHADAEQDPASRNNADPCGSGSTTLAVVTLNVHCTVCKE